MRKYENDVFMPKVWENLYNRGQENKYEYGYMCTLCKGYSLKSLGVSLDEWKKVDPIIEDKVMLMNEFENRDYVEKEFELRDYDGIKIIRENEGFLMFK